MIYSKETIKIRLKKLIKETEGMNQSVLAKSLDVGNDTVSNWMSGKATPRTEQLLAICNLFKCDIGYLIDEAQTAKTKEVTDICKVTGLSEEAVNVLIEEVNNPRRYDIDRIGVISYNSPHIECINKYIAFGADISKAVRTLKKVDEAYEELKKYHTYETLLSIYKQVTEEAKKNYYKEDFELEDCFIKKYEAHLQSKYPEEKAENIRKVAIATLEDFYLLKDIERIKYLEFDISQSFLELAKKHMTQFDI